MAGDANAFGIVLATEDPCDVTAESGQAEARYVFLICSERCGSNLIAAILGAHSQVQSPPAYHFGRDVVLNLHLRDDPSGWEVVRQQLLERVRTQGSPEAAARVHGHSPGCVRAAARALRLLGPRAQARRKHGVRQGEQPAPKFVFQVRDPRDYLVSAEARRAFWAGNKFGSLRRALEVWREDQLGGLQVLGLLGPERVFFLRYEDLVSRPREVLEPLTTLVVGEARLA
jgi:hypothetical protein